MKSYEEVTKNLLERRARYVAEQSRKRKKLMGAAASLCCCLVAFMGFRIWQSGMLQNQPPVTLDSFIVGNNSDNNGVEQQTPNTNADTKNQIHILGIENMPNSSDKMFIALMSDDFIQMNHDEINEYYGVNILPTVPSDLESKEDQDFGIYKRKTNGELYYDGNKIQYSNEDFSRNVSVNVDKDCMPFDFGNLFAEIQTRSIINNVEVGIAQTPIGDMYAEFMYQNVGFRIYAYGLTQDEFVAIIESIVK